MSSDIIKNKRRNMPKVPHGGYQPEHERLGMEPKVYSVNPRDFQKSQPKKRTVMPNSGNNEEIMWPNALDENGRFFVHGSSKNEEFEYENVVDPRRPPPVIDDLEESVEEEAEEEIFSEDELDLSSFHSMEVGTFAIIYNNSILAVGKESDVKEFIMHLVSHYNINANDLLLLKRSSIKSGVFIDE